MILTIRPEPGASSTVAAGRELGLDITSAPLFGVVPVDWEAPDPAEVDALLIGSANAIRHGGPKLQQFAYLPVHAVGRTTAAVAEQAGLRVERVGEGGLQGIIDVVTGPIRYLRLAGRERVELSLPHSVSMEERVCYETLARPVPDEVARELGEGGIVLLHSAAAAAHFRAECERLALDKSALRLAVLGPRIAEAAGGGWKQLRVAVSPNDEALLALVADMCH